MNKSFPSNAFMCIESCTVHIQTISDKTGQYVNKSFHSRYIYVYRKLYSTHIDYIRQNGTVHQTKYSLLVNEIESLPQSQIF